MAETEFENMEDVELLEAPEDNARSLTSAMVITTFILSVIAFITMEVALGKWFTIGPFK